MNIEDIIKQREDELSNLKRDDIRPKDIPEVKSHEYENKDLSEISSLRSADLDNLKAKPVIKYLLMVNDKEIEMKLSGSYESMPPLYVFANKSNDSLDIVLPPFVHEEKYVFESKITFTLDLGNQENIKYNINNAGIMYVKEREIDERYEQYITQSPFEYFIKVDKKCDPFVNDYFDIVFTYENNKLTPLSLKFKPKYESDTITKIEQSLYSNYTL